MNGYDSQPHYCPGLQRGKTHRILTGMMGNPGSGDEHWREVFVNPHEMSNAQEEDALAAGRSSPVMTDDSPSAFALITTDHGRLWRSRTELEIDRMDLCEGLKQAKYRAWSAEDRLKREMETSIRIGAQLIRAEEHIRILEGRLAHAQRKLGHEV